MNSEGSVSPRSTHGVQSAGREKVHRRVAESKCPACGQGLRSATDELLRSHPGVVAFPASTSGKVDGKDLSADTDLEKVLHFSQHLYAHALTLQELIRTEGEIRYEVLRPRYDRQAAQQFEIFYRALGRVSEFRKPASGNL